MTSDDGRGVHGDEPRPENITVEFDGLEVLNRRRRTKVWKSARYSLLAALAMVVAGGVAVSVGIESPLGSALGLSAAVFGLTSYWMVVAIYYHKWRVVPSTAITRPATEDELND